MKNEKLNVKIKPFGFLDLLTFKKLIPSRKERIAAAPADPVQEAPPVNVLARRLHPEAQYLEVAEVRQETDAAKTFRLVPDAAAGTKELAVFRPGQYLSFSLEIEGASVTRPYSISSAPADALGGFYEVTVKRNEGGFASNFIWQSWTVGSKVKCSGPQGHFCYEPLRDARKLVGIAGGCGVTPFRSMAKSILDGSLDVELTIFYGSNIMSEAVFREEFRQIEDASGGRVRVIHVLANEDAEGCERGFITAELLQRYVDPAQCSFFICGPQAMYQFVEKELKTLGLRQKFFRWELFGEIKNVRAAAGYPQEAGAEPCRVTVHMGSAVQEISASPDESLLVAMERAGLRPPSVCRSGMCGFCRSALIKGDVFIPDSEDGRRLADKELGFVHPCSAFPLSDLEIIVPRKR